MTSGKGEAESVLRQQIEDAINTTSGNNLGNDAIRLVIVSGLSLKSTIFLR